MTSDVTCVIIKEVQVEQLSEPETTYNFESADFHTYYVGNGVLVHNMNCDTIVETIETKAPNTMKMSEATDAWDDFLGNGQHDVNPLTGKRDANRLFSADSTKSIRFSPHEMNSLGTTKAHFHFETWSYNSKTNHMTIFNLLQRLRK